MNSSKLDGFHLNQQLSLIHIYVVKLNEERKIIIDHKTQQTSSQGIWAAGDCTDTLYHQNNIAAGDAVKAIENIYQELHRSY